MDSPLLTLPDAVPAEGRDAGVPAHYGDPYGEQRALAEAVAFVDRGHRDVLTVSGADRLSWLHDLTSQHLSQLPPGVATQTLVLDGNGHVEHHLHLSDDGESTWIDVDPGMGASLLDYLDRMRFMLRVEPREVSEDWAVLTVAGPGVPALLGSAYADEPGGVVAGPHGSVASRHDGPLPHQVDLRVPRAELAALVRELRDGGARPAGMQAYEALRVAAAVPRVGLDSDHRTIPNETAWLTGAVHLAKGCYRGQETVARVHNLGQPPRRLVLLHLDGSDTDLPPAGATVLLGERTVGAVGSVVRHHELGPLALALVKRTVPDDAVLTVGGIAASIDAEVTPAMNTGPRVRPADRLRAGR